MANREVVETIARIPIFRSLDPSDLQDLAARAARNRVAAGTTVVQQGETGANVYAVLSGRLKAQRTRGDETVLLGVMVPGQIFGELALLMGSARTASVVALEDCELLTIDQRDLRHLLSGRPDLAMELLGSLASRIVSLTERVEEFHTLCVGPRLASRVCSMAVEHGREGKGTWAVDLGFSQSDWADLIGANRGSVNRQFRAWEEEGLTEFDGRTLLIRDLEALRLLADLAGFVV